MDLRYLSKNHPVILNGHEGKSITSIQFQKNQKTKEKEKETNKSSTRSKTEKVNLQPSNSVRLIRGNDENKESSKELIKEESKFNKSRKNSSSNGYGDNYS